MRSRELPRLLVCAVLLSIVSCGGGGTSSPPPPPPPPTATITSVRVSPESAGVFVDKTQQFSAVVSGTGNYDSSVTWAVNGVAGGNVTLGTISVNGLYSAPSSVPTEPISVTATSKADTSKAGSASVTIKSTVVITVSPSSVELLSGSQQQFTATVTGSSDKSYTWGCSAGTISSGGLYTAPEAAGPYTAVVTATANADLNVTAQATISIKPRAPALTKLDPAEVGAADFLHISGTSLYGPSAVVWFPTADGVQVPVRAYDINTDHISAAVPLGTTSGDIYVDLTQYDNSVVHLGPLTLKRRPYLRLWPTRNDLASGEIARIHLRFLGDPTPLPIQWTTDKGGISSDGLFTAPVVTSTGYAVVTACVNNTTNCSHVRLRIHPFRIEPFQPIVEPGESLQLGATQNNFPLYPSWSLLSGGGTLLAGGMYSAGTTIEDSGSGLAVADMAGVTEETNISVPGHIGFVGRIAEYVDIRQIQPRAMSADTVTVAGNRAYVSSTDQINNFPPFYFYTDVYDITDPKRPAWVDSFEPVTSPLESRTHNGILYLFNTSDYIAGQHTGRIAAYDITGLNPRLLAVADFSQVVVRFHQGVFHACEIGVGSTLTCSRIAWAGNGFEKMDLQPISFNGLNADFVGTANRIYVASAGAIEVFDTSVSPPAFLTRASFAPDNVIQTVPAIFGDRLFAGGGVFDISGDTPRYLGPAPLAQVADVKDNVAIGLGSYWELRVVDLSGPEPQWTSSMVDQTNNAWRAALANGGVAYLPQKSGGLAIADVSGRGGYLVQRRTGTYCGIVNDEEVIGNTLISAEDYGSASRLLLTDVNTGSETNFNLGDDVPYALQIVGNTLLIGAAKSLRVVDVSNPAQPAAVRSLPNTTFTMAIQGNRMYAGTVSGTSYGILVFDITTPSNPRLLNTVELPGPPVKIVANGTILLVATGSTGLRVFSLQNPDTPQPAGVFFAEYPVLDVALAGTNAYVAAAQSGLVVLDLSNPAEPVSRSITPVPLPWNYGIYAQIPAPQYWPQAYSVTVHDGLVYLGTLGISGLGYVYDVTSPVHPRVVGLTPTFGYFDSFIQSFTFTSTNLFTSGYAESATACAQPGVMYMANQPRNVINLFPGPIDLLPSGPSAAATTTATVTESNDGAERRKRTPWKLKLLGGTGQNF